MTFMENFIDRILGIRPPMPTMTPGGTIVASPVMGALRSELPSPPTHAAPTPVNADEAVIEVASEILAWRGWHLAGDDPKLFSFNHTPWDGPVLTAHEMPDPSNASGIYGLRVRPSGVEQDTGYFLRAAYGQVALSGAVVEGERGYRGERAVIRSLWLANPAHFAPLHERFCLWELAGMLSERYGVECEIATTDWPAVVADFQYFQRVAFAR